MVRRPQVHTLAVAGVLVAATTVTTLELVNFYRPHAIASMSMGHLPWPIFVLSAGTTYHASVDTTGCGGVEVQLASSDSVSRSQDLTGVSDDTHHKMVEFTVPRSGSYVVQTAEAANSYSGPDPAALLGPCSMQVTITG